MRIAAQDPQAVVAFLTTDHYISDSAKFVAQIRAALDIAVKQRGRVVLLGLEPESPEVVYGWIEPARAIHGEAKVFGLRRFWEKPNRMFAQLFFRRCCLWNSFVMVASAQALLNVVASAIPYLYCSFTALTPLFGTTAETKAIAALYSRLAEINLSHQILTLKTEKLAVLKVSDIRWNDHGEPQRVMASLEMAGVRPQWAEKRLPQFA